MHTARPLDVVHAAYAAFASGNRAAVLALVSPGTVWTLHAPEEHPHAGVWRGPKGVEAFLGAIAASVQVVAFGIDEEHVAGDVVVCVGHETVRHKMNGESNDTRWIHRFRVVAGRSTRFEEWYDTATFMAAATA